MVGNDVVDLSSRDCAPESPRSRFDERVFSAEERQAIAENSDPHRTRWSLWAAKEAAYKAAKRIDRSTVWSPMKFRVRHRPGAYQGRVLHGSDVYALRFIPTPGAVHALVVAEEHADGLGDAAGPLFFGCRRGRVIDPSAEVRELAREILAPWIEAPPAAIEFRRDQRIPELWCDGIATEAPISLSHHGDLVAFACWLDRSRSRS